MPGDDPKQVIIEHISQPLGPLEPSPPPPAGVQLRGQPGMIRRGGGLGARASTVRFLQERSLPGRQLYVVMFENEEGQQEQWFQCVLQDMPDHWRNAGGANIGKGEEMPKRDYPWVNLAGGWRRDLFWAGGRVLDNGLNVVRVRLISEDRIVLEDTVQDGLVLFVTDQWVQRPLQVELYDRSGNLVGTHQALKPHPSEHIRP
jgi:hypothetical protein